MEWDAERLAQMRKPINDEVRVATHWYVLWKR